MQRALRPTFIAVALALVAACSAIPFTAANQLLSSLPTEAGGAHFDDFQIIDDRFMSGHATDDVLTALGKRRGDAAAVFRYDSLGGVSIGALAVRGVSGRDLLAACVENWEAPAVVRRSERAVNDTNGWEIATRGGHFTVFYARGNVVFVAWSDQRDALEAVLPDMP
jgi:hypothetical protein